MIDRELSRRRLFGIAASAALTAGCGTAHGDSITLTSTATPVTTATTVPITASAQVPLPAAVAARHAGTQPRQWGVALPGITSSFTPTADQIALTFDACGGPGNNEIDQALVDFLVAQQIPATLFLNRRWIDADPARTMQLGANPLFELANHGSAHKPLSVTGRAAYGIAGTTSTQEAAEEVWTNHLRLTELTGTPPRFFRAGTAHYDEIAVAIIEDLGETPIGFTLNADHGATATATQVASAMRTATPGTISLAHLHRPRSGTAAGMIDALPALRALGFTFIHL
ncbi:MULTISPECIES: polysaccharide deacetylase family protein [Nocardia]|uniref:polysaccharide deacetylase family protein n=1 Tax=Nocardia TaxID=1817 RepID=UPI000D68CAD9|nr:MULTISPECIES: polysaccharide deacetylase family protein [Nocardia]